MANKKGSVLCVDDEPGILRSLKWLLQKDFEVATAGSGDEALALVRENDFDVVISDQRMPGMTGVELLREVCHLAPRAMRILLTGYSDLDAVTRSVNESEIFRFINKPWHVGELPEVVAEAARIARSHPVPRAVAPEAPAQPGDEIQATETVLVIDHDPQLAEVLRQLLRSQAWVIHASTLAEAIDALATHPELGLIFSDTRVEGLDTTRLLKLLKERCPGIVTVALSSHMDAQEIIALINQGQVYRFLQKPVKLGYLKLVVTSALLKRQQLRESPDFAKRHAVDKLAGEAREAFASELQRLGLHASPGAGEAHNPAGIPWLQRFTSGLRFIFG